MRQGITEFQEPPTGIGLTEDTTVNLVATDTATEIQALIDAQPKNLNSFTLTFQFADGTYTLDAQLLFEKFYNGAVNIYGKSTDSTLSTTKAVFLDFTGSTNGIFVQDCNAFVAVKFFKINHITSSNFAGIKITRCNQEARVQANYIAGSETTNGQSIHFYLSPTGWTENNYVSNAKDGIYARTGTVHSKNNDDTGTDPLYGLHAFDTGTIGKEGTQPDGSTGNELIVDGGLIRN